MGVRTANHQKVGGKQYFEDEVQFNSTLQAVKQEVITPTTGTALTHDQSGATVILGDNVDLTLPAPKLGVNYKFVVNAAHSATSEISCEATCANCMFGVVDIAGTPTKKVDVDQLEFTANADEGDWAEIVCVSETTTSGNPSWHVYGVGAAGTSINITT